MNGRPSESVASGTLRRVPDDGALLAQISIAILEAQEELKQAIVVRQGRGNQSFVQGEILGEKRLTLLVDYPILKERTTTLMERIFYEREYVRQTILIREVQIPSYTEELNKRTVLEHIAARETEVPRSTAPITSETGHDGGQTAVSELKRSNTPETTLGQPSVATASQANPKADNPFKDFVQPRQQASQSQSTQATLPAPAREDSLNGSQSDKGKKRKKFGLKWFFSAPFKSGKESRPDMEEISDRQSNDTNSEAPSSVGQIDEPRADVPPHTALPAPPSESITNDAPRTEAPVAGLSPVAGPPAIARKQTYNHEEAVRRALQEGAADETQRELFTQIEEECDTIERVERFVDHQYTLREYRVWVVYTGERAVGHSVELLTRAQYIMAGSQRIKQVALTQPGTLT